MSKLLLLMQDTLLFILQLKLTFNDDATSTYEYPSEQWLMEALPPEPETVSTTTANSQDGSSEMDSGLLSNPAIGSSGE